jgi:putative chitinase
MALKSDNLGFLVGEPLNKPSDVSPVDILKEIKGDTAAIRKGLKDGVRDSQRMATTRRNSGDVISDREVKKIAASIVKASSPQNKRKPATVQRERDERGRFVATKKPPPEANKKDKSEKPAATEDKQNVNAKTAEDKKTSLEKAVETGKAVANEMKRGKDGRFIGGDGEGKKKKQGKERGGLFGFGREKDGDSKKIAEAMKSGASAAGTDVEKIDPFIEAGREMKDMGRNFFGVAKVALSPLMILKKPLAKMFGFGDKKEKPAKRSVQIQKKMLKKLKEIEQNKGGKKGGLRGLLSAVGGNFKKVLFGVLLTLFTPVGTLLKVGFMGAGKLLFTALKLSFGVVGRGLLMALGGAGKLLMGAMRLAFSPVGALLAAAFGGWSFGTWLYEKYGEQIQDGIEAIETGAKGAWQFVKDSFTNAIKTITDTWNSIVESVTATFEGIGQTLSNIPAILKDAIKSKFGLAGSSSANRKELERIADKQNMSAAEKQAFMKASSDQTGGFMNLAGNNNLTPTQLLERYRGRNGLETIEQARAIVAGGESSINEAIYGGEFGLSNLGNVNAGDAQTFKGRGFANLSGRSDYAAAGEALGIDLINNPELASNPEVAAKIAGWKWESSGAKKAVKTGNINQATFNKSNIPTASATSSTSVFPEMQAYINNLTGGVLPVMAGGDAFGGNGMVMSANIKATSIPKQQALKIPLNSTNTNKTETKTMVQLPFVGQNISDRGIAQTVTGGMGSNQ